MNTRQKKKLFIKDSKRGKINRRKKEKKKHSIRRVGERERERERRRGRQIKELKKDKKKREKGMHFFFFLGRKREKTNGGR